MFCSLGKVLEVVKVCELKGFTHLSDAEKYRVGRILGCGKSPDLNDLKSEYEFFCGEFNLQMKEIAKFPAKNAKKCERSLRDFLRRIILNIEKIGSFDIDKIGLDDAVWILRQNNIGIYRELIEAKIEKASGDLIMKFRGCGDDLEALSMIWGELKNA